MTSREQKHLIGHDSVEDFLLGAWKNDKLPHSLIFSGPYGIGRATLAYRLAKFLLSNSDKDVDTMALPDDHPVGRRVVSGGHGDLLVVEPDPEKVTKVISVEQVRRIKDFLAQTPLEGGWRIVIVDGEMNGSAANAILKVLEEPPKKSLLILITESVGRVLPTIRSRCHQFKLKPLSEDQVRQVIKAEQACLDDEDVRILTALCDGRPGLALDYYQADAVEMYTDILKLLTKLSPFDTQLAQTLCQKYSGKGEKGAEFDSFQVVADCLRRFIQKMTLYGTLKETQSTLPEEVEAFQHGLSLRSATEWAKTWEDINQSFRQAQQFHLDKSQVMLLNLCKMAGVTP